MDSVDTLHNIRAAAAAGEHSNALWVTKVVNCVVVHYLGDLGFCKRVFRVYIIYIYVRIHVPAAAAMQLAAALLIHFATSVCEKSPKAHRSAGPRQRSGRWLCCQHCCCCCCPLLSNPQLQQRRLLLRARQRQLRLNSHSESGCSALQCCCQGGHHAAAAESAYLLLAVP